MENLSLKEIEQLLIIDKEIMGSADYAHASKLVSDAQDNGPSVTVFTTMLM